MQRAVAKNRQERLAKVRAYIASGYSIEEALELERAEAHQQAAKWRVHETAP
jgi:hypothetical protein